MSPFNFLTIITQNSKTSQRQWERQKKMARNSILSSHRQVLRQIIGSNSRTLQTLIPSPPTPAPNPTSTSSLFSPVPPKPFPSGSSILSGSSRVHFSNLPFFQSRPLSSPSGTSQSHISFFFFFFIYYFIKKNYYHRLLILIRNLIFAYQISIIVPQFLKFVIRSLKFLKGINLMKMTSFKICKD